MRAITTLFALSLLALPVAAQTRIVHPACNPSQAMSMDPDPTAGWPWAVSGQAMPNALVWLVIGPPRQSTVGMFQVFGCDVFPLPPWVIEPVTVWGRDPYYRRCEYLVPMRAAGMTIQTQLVFWVPGLGGGVSKTLEHKVKR